MSLQTRLPTETIALIKTIKFIIAQGLLPPSSLLLVSFFLKSLEFEWLKRKSPGISLVLFDWDIKDNFVDVADKSYFSNTLTFLYSFAIFAFKSSGSMKVVIMGTHCTSGE